MFGAILNLFAANKQQRAEQARYQLAREDALAAEQRQLGYNQQAYAQFRADAQADYAQSRGDMLFDYARQRADNLADYERQRADARSDTLGQFSALREAAEAGGFNPLAVLGMGSGVPSSFGISGSNMGAVSKASGQLVPGSASSIGYVPPTDYMSGAIAEAGSLLQSQFLDAVNKPLFERMNALAAHNAELRRELDKERFAPSVPGVYAQRQTNRVLGEERPGMLINGLFVPRPDGWMSGQEAENELGEIGGNAYGVTLGFPYAFSAGRALRERNDFRGYASADRSKFDTRLPSHPIEPTPPHLSFGSSFSQRIDPALRWLRDYRRAWQKGVQGPPKPPEGGKGNSRYKAAPGELVIGITRGPNTGSAYRQ